MLIFVELRPIGVGVSGVPAIFDISALHSLTSLRLNLSAQTAKAPTRSWGSKALKIMACATRLEMMATRSPWTGIKPTLQCKLGARVPLVPRNQWQGGTGALCSALCPPPQVIRFGTPWMGSPHLSRHDPDSSKNDYSLHKSRYLHKRTVCPSRCNHSPWWLQQPLREVGLCIWKHQQLHP